MISLKGSRFIVEYNEDADDGYSVYTRKSATELEDITNKLTDDDKTELISDLVYAITDLLGE